MKHFASLFNFEKFIVIRLQFLVNLYFVILSNTFCSGQTNTDLLGKQADIVLVEQSPGNEHEVFPDTYSIWFFHEQEKMLLDLIRDDKVTEALCPSVFRLANFLPNELMVEENEHEFAFYHNNQPLESDDRAHFVLHRQDLSKPADIYGQINHNGYQYIIQPSGKGNRYRYREVIQLAELRAKKDYPPIAGVDNILEVIVWIAPDLFKFTKSRLGFENNQQTAVWTETFRSSLIRDVDLTFRTLTEVSIRVQYVGGGDTQRSQEPWYKDNFNDPYLAQENALTDFVTYIQTLNGVLPSYDHAVVLTRADIARDTTGRSSKRQAVATGTICEGATGSSVSMAEVSGPFLRKIIAQAIGLGFGLGYTFGDDLHNVMARDSPSFPIPDDKAAALWQFTSTRESQLKNIVDSYSTNCMKIQSAGQDFDDFIKLDTYGETYSNDEQCDNVYGDGSVVCGGNTNPAEMCYKEVRCQVSGSCNQYILLGDHSICDVNNLLGCRYGACTRDLDSTTTSSTTTSSTISTTTTITVITESTTADPDCCCEERPLGDVKVNIEYIPCPAGDAGND